MQPRTIFLEAILSAGIKRNEWFSLEKESPENLADLLSSGRLTLAMN
jgi:hypothetical protein